VLIIYDALPKAVVESSKVMESISHYCKKTKISAIVNNHMTSRGDPAGSSLLEHFADTDLVMGYSDDEDIKDEDNNVRVLHVHSRNRHGSCAAKSYWKMSESGILKPVLSNIYSKIDFQKETL